MIPLRYCLYAALAGLCACAAVGSLALLYAQWPPLEQQAAATPMAQTMIAQALSPRTAALTLLALTAVLGSSLLGLLHFRILRPLRHLHHELGSSVEARGPRQGKYDLDKDEVQAAIRRARRLHEKIQRAESQLEESHENLRHTEKLAMVGKLAAGVAHSIRNPLTGVKLRLFALTKGLALSEGQQEDLEAINDAVRHMESITSNFLEFSRRPRLSKTHVNLSQVVDGTLSLLKMRLESFQVRVHVHRGDAMPTVDADAEQLREALANIIINACEAMGVGGEISITEESGQLSPLGKVAVLRVADSGPGISGEMQDVIFQPFISTKAEGTGLGLPIAQKIFEEHGGWLHLHSTPGRGATFVAVLPACANEDVWTRS